MTGAVRRAAAKAHLRAGRREPAEPSAGLQRLPFSVPDEVCCYCDSPAEPSSIHLEVSVPGHLDELALRAAAAAALAANHRASSRRARRGPLSLGYAWERPPRLDFDPVSFTSFADASELAAARADFISVPPPIDRAPPALLLVAHGPEGDHVILNAHHAPMDGLSWLELLRDVGRRYRAITADRQGPAGPATASPPASDTKASKAPADFRSVSPAPPLPDLVPRGPARKARRPARIAAEGGGRRGYGLVLILLDDVPVVPPFSSGDGQKATLNEALVTALIAAIGRWNAEHGRPAHLIRITTPVNARIPGAVLPAGNLSRLVTITAAPPAEADDLTLTHLLLEVAHQARTARQHQGPAVGAGSRGIAAARLPVGIKRWAVRGVLRTAGPLVCDTAMLTNLGNVTEPPDFGLPGSITMAFSAQAQMPRGLTVGAITSGGRLQLVLRYNRALFDQAAAARFADCFRRALEAIISPAGIIATTAQ